MSDEAAAELPLAGIRVVEIAHYVAVPCAGTLLADLGAEVVKIESPRGELYRRSRPRYAGYASGFPENPAFHMDNRGKECLALDITQPDARAAVLRLVDRADVFLTNLLPQRRRKFGFDHETLLARKPSLIVGAINGYGSGGDRDDEPAFDYTAYWARTGLMDGMRDEGVPPSLQRPAVGDHAAGSNLVCAILCALRLRDADGRGRYVETSLLQTGLHVYGTDVTMALVTGERVKRHDRSATLNPLWNSYPVADDRWLVLVMIDPDRYWSRLCDALERPDLAADARFADARVRAEHAPVLIAELEKTFRSQPLAVWEERLEAAGIIWAPVLRADEAARDPHARAMDYLRTVEHETGPIETVGPPFRIDGLRLGGGPAASPVNRSARRIFRDVGLGDAEIDALLGD